MADVLIKNMELPKACYQNNGKFCPCYCLVFLYTGGSKRTCMVSDCKPLKTRRPKECPLVDVVPVEHGKVYPVDAKFWMEAST